MNDIFGERCWYHGSGGANKKGVPYSKVLTSCAKKCCFLLWLRNVKSFNVFHCLITWVFYEIEK